MKPLRLAALAVVLLGAAPRPSARVVLLPFEEPGGHGAAPAIHDAVAERLGRAGYEVVSGEPVEAFLAARRIRYLDSLAPDALDALLAAFDAKHAVVGTVLLATERPAPLVAISARMIGPGARVEWADLVTVRGEAGTRAFGRGKLPAFPELCRDAAARLVARAPDPGERGAPHPRGPARRASGAEAVAWRAPELERMKRPAIVVMPPVNRTPSRWAGRVATELLVQRLAGTGRAAVIEPAAMREAALATGARLAGGAATPELAKIGDRLGVHLFLVGTLLALDETPGAGSAVALSLSLVDARSGRILWTAYEERGAEEHLGLLERAPLRDPVSIADQVVADLVTTLF